MHHFPIVFDRPVALFLHLKGCVLHHSRQLDASFRMTNARQTCLLRLAANSDHYHLCQFFASKLPVCLGPFDLSGISLHLEVFVALTPTEVEHLNALAFSTTSLYVFSRRMHSLLCCTHRCVVPYKRYSMAGVDCTGAEPALL